MPRPATVRTSGPIAAAVVACILGCGDPPTATPPPNPASPAQDTTAGRQVTAAPVAEPPTGTTSAGRTTATATGTPAADGRLRVEPGDSLSKILHAGGLDARGVHELTSALTPLMDPTTIHAGQTYRVEQDDGGRLVGFQFDVSRILRIDVARDDKGQFVAKKQERDVEVEEIVVGGTVTTSLSEAISKQGEQASLVSFFVDVFAYDINFFVDTRPGDAFRMIVEKTSVDGEHLGYRRVLAAEYSGDVGTFQAFWWQPKQSRKGRYIDGEGRGVVKTLLKTPLKFTRVSSEFNPRRMHPILHKVKGHNGVDYAAPTGTPVRAAAGGIIKFRDHKRGAGNLVVLKHDDGMQTLYMHLDRFRSGQKVGQRVEQKTVIGYVGSTGLATGPHLHFGLKIGARYVDPLKIKQRRGPGVGSGQRAAFRRLKKDLLEKMSSTKID